MEFSDFGERLRQIREEVLKLTQVEMAQEMDTTQAIVSRAERAMGMNIFFMFEILNYLHNKGLRGHMMLREVFDIDMVR